MEPKDWQMKPYFKEVAKQAEAAMVNARRFKAAILDDSPYANMDAFAAVQGILTAAGQLHQLLWVDQGVKPREYVSMVAADWEGLKAFSRARAKRLRKVLRTGDSSPIKSRAGRNSFEHLDSRLDEHLALSTFPLIDRIIGDPESDMDIGGTDRAQFLRIINPRKADVSVLGDSVSIPDLCEELARVGTLARAEIGLSR